MSAPRSGVTGRVLGLAVPAVLTSLVQTLVFLADRVMLARHSEASLASMQIQGPILWSVFSVFLGLIVGTVALVARAIGRGDNERASTVARASILLAGELGLVVGVLGTLSTPLIVMLMDPGSEAIAAASRGYMFVAFPAFPAAFVSTAAAMILNGAGDTRTPLVVGAIANLANILSNLVFIFGVPALGIPELGATGAAIGTAISFHIQIALYVVVARRSQLDVAGVWLRRKDPGDKDARSRVISLSTPALLERIVIHTGFVLFAAAVTRLGPETMAANQAMITLESICFLCADGFGVAAATVVGQSLGQGRPAAATRGGLVATFAAAGVLGACGVIIWLTSPWTLPIFEAPASSSREFIALARTTMPLLALGQPLMGGAVVLGHALRGAGDTRSPVVAAALGGLLIRVVGAWVLAVHFDVGLFGIWLVTTADWGVRLLVLGVVFVRGRWQSIEV